MHGRYQCKINHSTLAQKTRRRPAPTSQTLQRALDILLETDLRAEIGRLKPTLLIHGDRDTLAPVQAAHWMMQNLPVGYLGLFLVLHTHLSYRIKSSL